MSLYFLHYNHVNWCLTDVSVYDRRHPIRI